MHVNWLFGSRFGFAYYVNLFCHTIMLMLNITYLIIIHCNYSE